MTSAQRVPDATWAGYADMEASQRESEMLQRFRELAALDEDARRDQMQTIVMAEYSLPNDKLKPLSMSRLRALLQLDRDEAQRIAGSYDAAMRMMPAEAAMRRVTIVQSLAGEFSKEDEAQLIELLPNVFAGATSGGAIAATMSSVRGFTKREVVAAKSSKPFWAFWKK
jgi:hypothetical protein